MNARRDRITAAARAIARIGGGLYGWRMWKPWLTARHACRRRREWRRGDEFRLVGMRRR